MSLYVRERNRRKIFLTSIIILNTYNVHPTDWNIFIFQQSYAYNFCNAELFRLTPGPNLQKITKENESVNAFQLINMILA